MDENIRTLLFIIAGVVRIEKEENVSVSCRAEAKPFQDACSY